MTTTTTVTKTTLQETFVLSSEKPHENPKSTSLTRLVSIFQNFEEEWSDPKSEQIKDFIAEIIDLKSENEVGYIPAFEARPKEYLSFLVHKILVDDVLEEIHLVQPILIKELNISTETLFFKASNITNKEVPYTTVPHHLAIQMIKWVKEFELVASGASLAREEPSIEIDIESLKGSTLGRMALMTYSAKLNSLIFNRDLKKEAIRTAQMAKYLKELESIIQEKSKEQESRLEKEMAETKARITEKFNEQAKKAKDDLKPLEESLKSLQDSVTELKESNRETSRRCLEKELEILRLKDAIAVEQQRVAYMNAVIAAQSRKRKKFLGIF